MTEIKTRKDYINLYADKICGRMQVVDENTGRFDDYFVPDFSAMYHGLDRFIEAQNKWDTYQTALAEVKAGKKVTHWIWFIFPQLTNLGKSEKSRYYGIRGREEAIEYINNPILRDRLVEITEAVYNNEKSVYEIFGNDVIKVRACMLLFASVSDIPIFKKMLEKHCWR